MYSGCCSLHLLGGSTCFTGTLRFFIIIVIIILEGSSREPRKRKKKKERQQTKDKKEKRSSLPTCICFFLMTRSSRLHHVQSKQDTKSPTVSICAPQHQPGNGETAQNGSRCHREASCMDDSPPPPRCGRSRSGVEKKVLQ